MSNSKIIAGIVGPTIVAMVVSEVPLVQPHLFDTQIPPVIYLSGTVMFVGGLAVVRVHNRWTRDWTVLVSLSGWCFILLGLFRMFAADAYQRGSESISVATFMVLIAILAMLGLVMTIQGYRRDGK
jgi:1,4-dihydroxy-2-naphthoate octaprenyltransferase